jgi:polysaccharide export outer membrane protein
MAATFVWLNGLTMMQNDVFRYGLLALAALLVTACSSSYMHEDETGTNAAAVNEQNLFSSINDLDYAAKAEDYRIGVADLLKISVFRAEEFGQEARVDSDGSISLPLLGNVRAEGLTPSQLEQQLANLLKQKYLQNPQVTVFVKEYSSQQITLDGAFNKPGIYPVTAGQVTLLQALALGGGLDSIADPGKVVLFRKIGSQPKAYRLNIDAIRGGQMKNPYLRNNDIIVAHRSNSRYWLREVASTISSARTIVSPF